MERLGQGQLHLSHWNALSVFSTRIDSPEPKHGRAGPRNVQSFPIFSGGDVQHPAPSVYHFLRTRVQASLAQSVIQPRLRSSGWWNGVHERELQVLFRWEEDYQREE